MIWGDKVSNGVSIRGELVVSETLVNFLFRHEMHRRINHFLEGWLDVMILEVFPRLFAPGLRATVCIARIGQNSRDFGAQTADYLLPM